MGLLQALIKFEHIYIAILAAGITLFAGFLIAKLTGKLVKRIMVEAELNRILTKAGFKPLSDSLAHVVELLIYFATILIVLQQLGLTTIALGILSLLAILLLGFVLFLTVKNFIPNAIAGFLLRKELHQHLKKRVRIGTVKGTLSHAGIVASTLQNKDEHSIPHLYTSKHKIKPLRAS